jgi:hypothetical protein
MIKGNSLGSIYVSAPSKKTLPAEIHLAEVHLLLNEQMLIKAKLYTWQELNNQLYPKEDRI